MPVVEQVSYSAGRVCTMRSHVDISPSPITW